MHPDMLYWQTACHKLCQTQLPTCLARGQCESELANALAYVDVVLPHEQADRIHDMHTHGADDQAYICANTCSCII